MSLFLRLLKPILSHILCRYRVLESGHSPDAVTFITSRIIMSILVRTLNTDAFFLVFTLLLG